MRRIGTILFIAILTPLLISASGDRQQVATGTITGTITDKETGAPIIGASVLVVRTSLWVYCDSAGTYRIEGVEPGTYKLAVHHREYYGVEVTDLVVRKRETTRCSVVLEERVVEWDSLSVVGTRDRLEIREVANQATISKEEIKMKPVTTVDELLKQSPGVVADKEGKTQIRGGRAGEASSIAPMYPKEMIPYPSTPPCPPGYQPPYPPAHGGSAIVNGQPYDAMFFQNYGVNPFVDTDDDHFSTFAIDVDEASYVMTRSYLERGNLPPADAVRTEEFVNHFTYAYEPPRRETFRVYADGAPSVFGGSSRLLRIGIKGQELDPEERKPATLVFVIDVSGSMGQENRLGLVKQSLRYLVDQLDRDDRVGIVVYGSRGQVLLEPTGVGYRHHILRVIEQLQPGGSTNAEEGLRLGYQMADRYFVPGRINRIILCSDGVANVGRTGPDDILKQIKRYADKGITLTAVGFGMGNYNDVLMEQLGNKGNGFYAYVDDLAQARRVFVENLNGTLQVIARDVKIQVDFNPNVVRSYRLLGYENRDVADRDFRNDAVDGGEVGAGHQVTALYEIKLWEKGRAWERHRVDGGRRGGDIGTVYIRYKDPDHGEVSEIRGKIGGDVFADEFEEADSDLKLAAAAAEFAEILRGSFYAKDARLADVLRVVRDVQRYNDSREVFEFAELVSRAMHYEDQLAEW